MRRSTLTALLAATALVSAATPIAAAPSGTGPVGASAVLIGAGMAEGDFGLPLQQGKGVSVETVTVGPGQFVDWGSEPGSAIVIVRGGEVSHFENCATKHTWSGGHTYFHAITGDPAAAMTVNEGDSDASLLVVRSGAAAPAEAAEGGHGGHGGEGAQADHHAPQQVSGCPAATAPAQVESNGTGPAYNNDTVLQQTSGNQIGVYVFRLEPGYTSDWHTHPDANLVVQTKGVLENWNGCKEKEVWDPGNTYFHSPGHHGKHQNLTNNKTSEPAELVAVLFNLPGEYPASVPPVFKAPPPSECPTSAATY